MEGHRRKGRQTKLLDQIIEERRKREAEEREG